MNAAQEKLNKYGEAKFYRKKDIITKPERVMFLTLKLALGGDYYVMPQFAMSQLICTRGGDRKQNYGLYGTARQMVLDFLILDKGFEPIAAIELDDNTHRKWERKKSDDYKDLVLNEVGIPIIRANVKTMPRHNEIEELRNVILS